ncbi:MAG: Rrf2 family transcriptional regulator [Planctomycetota bacterium]
MLQLTKRTEYGLVALIHLVEQGGVVPVREICERHPSLPKRLVAEVLKELHRGGFVESQRGAAGGYSLARPAPAITLGEVVGALEGKPDMTECDLVGAWADRRPDVDSTCPVRNPLERLRTGIWNVLSGTTLEDLVRGRFRISPSMTAS